jgi:NAD-dependent deacetylase
METDFIMELKRSRYTVAFTGAGISADSGIPTFRGQDGLWAKYDPHKLASPEGFRENPYTVWEWYRWRMAVIHKAKPNTAHIALALLEKKGYIKSVITQNVDGLHQRAGSNRVIELHGNIWRARCTSCPYKIDLSAPPEEIPPKCPSCGCLLRPDVVWFGEPIPSRSWMDALNESEKCELMLVIGASMLVMPAANIPLIAYQNNSKIIEINPDQTFLSEKGISKWIPKRASLFFEEIYGELKFYAR